MRVVVKLKKKLKKISKRKKLFALVKKNVGKPVGHPLKIAYHSTDPQFEGYVRKRLLRECRKHPEINGFWVHKEEKLNEAGLAYCFIQPTSISLAALPRAA